MVLPTPPDTAEIPIITIDDEEEEPVKDKAAARDQSNKMDVDDEALADEDESDEDESDEDEADEDEADEDEADEDEADEDEADEDEADEDEADDNEADDNEADDDDVDDDENCAVSKAGESSVSRDSSPSPAPKSRPPSSLARSRSRELGHIRDKNRHLQSLVKRLVQIHDLQDKNKNLQQRLQEYEKVFIELRANLFDNDMKIEHFRKIFLNLNKQLSKGPKR
jgi:signal recognition particle GTPase